MNEQAPNNATTQTAAEILNTSVNKMVSGSQEALSAQQAADLLQETGTVDQALALVGHEIGKLTTQGFAASEGNAAILIQNPDARAQVYGNAGQRPASDEAGYVGGRMTYDIAGRRPETNR